MKTKTLLIMSAALAGCSPRSVEQSDFVGRWTWPGNDCAERQGLEFTSDAIILTARNGERGTLYRILKGTPQGDDRQEFRMLLELVPHAGMPPEERRLLTTDARYAGLFVRLENDRITPLYFSSTRGTTALEQSDQTYRLFNVIRCA